jgi:hypothetical protein
MMPPSGLSFFVTPAYAGIHSSARKLLPDSHERGGSLAERGSAAPWIPAFAGMTVWVGRAWLRA